MSDSLRDQLLAFGFKPAPKPERSERPAPQNRGPNGARPPHDKRAHERPARGKPDGASPQQPARRDQPRRPEGNRSANGGTANTANANANPRAAQGAQKPRRDERRGGSEMDLAKAYAIRAQKEKDERIAAEKARQEEAARRREGKLKLAELLKTASLNDANAEIARHFEYGGKIRRVYVTPEQLKAINGGELAIVQQGGRYHIVTPAHAHEAEALLSGALALLADPNVPSADDVYADPKYQVPDDLIW
jgi:uncharacterized protein YaiL (DUF2058 family)